MNNTFPQPRVLVVDDEPNIRSMLHETLAYCGCQVDAAGDGRQVLEFLKEQDYDIVLLDLNMPGGMHGLDVLRHIQSTHPQTVVILLTAYGTLEAAIEAIRYNVHDFLLKPCKTSQIQNSLRSALTERQARLRHREEGRLISYAVHEIRTAATGVSLSIDLLAMVPEHQKPQYIDILKIQSKRLSQIATDVLDLMKVQDAGSTSIQEIDINQLVSHNLPIYSSQATARSINLHWELMPGIPMVQIRPAQFEMILSNLITNAIHYTLRGEIRVSTCYDPQYERVGLAVQDTGVGILPADQPFLFKRFFRGQNVQELGLTGTGLGLAMVKEILDAHGGEITLESEPGRGSIFTAWLPISPAHEVAT